MTGDVGWDREFRKSERVWFSAELVIEGVALPSEDSEVSDMKDDVQVKDSGSRRGTTHAILEARPTRSFVHEFN